MARDKNALRGERPDGVRRDVRIPQTDDENAILRLHGKLRADLAREHAAGAAEGVLFAPDERVERDRDIAPHRFT